MKPEVTLKYLAYIPNKKNQDEGFTLIELLVVVIIIGVLAAVVLPNLLNQVGKARETEIKNAAGTVNRSQQAYHFERRSFATTLTQLGLQNALTNSDYLDDPTPVTIGSIANGSTVITNSATAITDGTRAYSAAIDFTAADSTYDLILCQSDNVITTGVLPTSATQCGAASAEIK